jgi:hypothetical protein
LSPLTGSDYSLRRGLLRIRVSDGAKCGQLT